MGATADEAEELRRIIGKSPALRRRGKCAVTEARSRIEITPFRRDSIQSQNEWYRSW